jgi:iron-sulfur cluster repair protein YtfE (RIC family)
MAELPPSSPEFQELLQEIKTAIEAHVTKEEDDIFPESIEVLGADRIEALGDEMESLKMEGGKSRTMNI